MLDVSLKPWEINTAILTMLAPIPQIAITADATPSKYEGCSIYYLPGYEGIVIEAWNLASSLLHFHIVTSQSYKPQTSCLNLETTFKVQCVWLSTMPSLCCLWNILFSTEMIGLWFRGHIETARFSFSRKTITLIGIGSKEVDPKLAASLCFLCRFCCQKAWHPTRWDIVHVEVLMQCCPDKS